MADYLTFPRGLLKPKAERWNLVGGALSGGTAISGATQTSSLSGGPYWQAELSGMWMRTAEHVKVWRALEALLDQGVATMIVPMCEARYSPSGETNLVSHSDTDLFEPDSDYTTGAALHTVVGATALRATQIVLDMNGRALVGGEHFTLNHAAGGPRLYRVARVVSVASENYTCKIRPPLRAAVSNGASADFANPRCLMKLSPGEAIGLSLEGNRFGEGAMNLTESFDTAALSDA